MKNFLFAILLLATSAFSQSRKVYIDALVDNHSKALLATSTQVGYLAGVTADIQTQINNVSGGGSAVTPFLSGVTLTVTNLASAGIVTVLPDSDVTGGKRAYVQGSSISYIGSSSAIPMGAGLNTCRAQSSVSLSEFFRADMSQYMSDLAAPGIYFMPTASPASFRPFNALTGTPSLAYLNGSDPNEGITFQCPSSGALSCMGPGSPVCDVLLYVWGVVK